MRRAPCSLPLAALAAACTESTEARPTVEIIDSAGVPVVVNSAPTASEPTFRLAAQPAASIGVTEGAPEYQLFQVRWGTVLSDGTIVITNGGTQELRFYDGAGKYLRSAAGKGEGPGEFTQIALVATLPGDSLLMSDIFQKRYSVFTSTGSFVRSFPASPEQGPAYRTPGALANGTLVVQALLMPPDTKPVSGSRRFTETVLLVSGDGTAVKALGEFPSSESSNVDGAGSAVLFGRNLHVRARGDLIAVANDDSYSIRLYDADGTLVRVVRQTREPVAVQPGDFERALPEYMQPGAPPSRTTERFTPVYDAMTRHTTFPAFGDGTFPSSIRLDPEGNLWVAEYKPPWVETTSFQAFGRDGLHLGRLDLPARFTLLDIGSDWILGRTQDEMDVERVVLYKLERETAAP